MAEKRDEFAVYAALAQGLGTLAKTQELRQEMTGEPRTDPSGPPEDYVEMEAAPSLVYQRVLEELSAYVTPVAADSALAGALEQSGVRPEDAGSLDIREALVELLPSLIGRMVSKDALELVLERLDHALTDVHGPPRVSATPKDG